MRWRRLLVCATCLCVCPPPPCVFGCLVWSIPFALNSPTHGALGGMLKYALDSSLWH